MKLIDYMRDPNVAEATEIYNAKFNSVEDVIALQKQISEEKAEFNVIIGKLNTILYNIKVGMSKIAYDTNRQTKLEEFKDSDIGKLIQTFIENNTPENMDAIRKSIEQSNDFGVVIVPEWKPGDGERMYGVPSCAHIHVGYTNTFYRFDNWDIDNDIQNIEDDIAETESAMSEFFKEKDEMHDKYGLDVLMQAFANFEKIHGPVKADENWGEWNFIYDYDDEY